MIDNWAMPKHFCLASIFNEPRVASAYYSCLLIDHEQTVDKGRFNVVPMPGQRPWRWPGIETTLGLKGC